MKNMILKSAFCLVPAFGFLCGCAEKIDTAEEYVQVAYRHERAAEYPQAVAAYRKSLELDENQANVWYDLGVAYSALDQASEAIDAYTRSIRLDETSARTYNNRAAAYARLKQYDKAIEDCSRAIELDPDDFLAWRNRGLARHDRGDLMSAISDYDQSIRINGRVAETYHSRGNVFLEQRQWNRALEDFDHAVRLDDKMATAWLSRAIALARLGRGSEAESSREKARTLGHKVDEVVIADLLPSDTDEVLETAELHLGAVEFVKSRLSTAEAPLNASTAPWDLQTATGTNERRLLVRVLTATGQAGTVQFTAADLETLKTQGVATTLVVVQPVSGKSSEVAAETEFRIVQNIDNWSPDLGQMQPVAWSLPVAIDETAETEPSLKNTEPIAAAER